MSDASHGFLGEEFLTWLWFRTETAGGELEVSEGKTVGFTIDDLIEFAPIEEDETQSAVKKGSPTRSAAARAALRSGRRLRRARLILAIEERTFGVTIDGQTLACSSVKVPDDDPDGETEDRSAERAGHFLEVEQLVQGMYRSFLARRLAPDYMKTEGEEQARWMSGS